jgi:hypothetical protein
MRDPEHGNRQPFSGGRIALGYWLVEENPWFVGGIRDLGVEAAFFFIGSRSVALQSNQAPNLIRAFSDVNNDQESGFVVTAPGVANGGMSVFSRISNFWGAEANLWKNLYYDCPGTVHSLSGLAGFRYLSVDYQTEIDSVSNFNPGLSPSSKGDQGREEPVAEGNLKTVLSGPRPDRAVVVQAGIRPCLPSAGQQGTSHQDKCEAIPGAISGRKLPAWRNLAAVRAVLSSPELLKSLFSQGMGGLSR